MAENDHELFLIDGNSLAYRAFFALPESIGTSDGRPTNAIYGLASMLVKVIDEHRPAGVVVAWDAGMSGREITYDLYKAQRKPRPDLLREQWPHLMPLVEAFGYTNVRVEGYEADDVIASLARRARGQGIAVMVVTGDRDAYQMVGEGIRVMSTSRGITETKIYDPEAVEERYGVPPELITDLMGLRGDTSDNIPGVPGIGEKTATQLLQQFGSLDEVLANVEKVSGAKRKQNLVEHADDARMSKRLATLQYDIETGVDLAAVMASEPDRGALRDFMRDFELRAVLERLEEALPEGDAVPGRSVETELEVEAVESTAADLGGGEGPLALAIDGERWAVADGERVLTGASSQDELAVGLGARPLVAHDAKSLGGGRHGLLAAAAREGVELRLDHDTMLAAYLLEPQRRAYELTELAADAGIGIAEGAAAAGDADGGQLSLDGDGETGLDPAEEAGLVAALAEAQRPRIEELGLAELLHEVELPLVHVLAAMEREGLKLDAERLAEVGAGFGERIVTLEQEIYALAEEEFTIGSPQQVGHILFEKLNLTRKRRGKTGYSTDARVLAQISDEHEIVAKIESWRELTKLKNTYLDSLPDLIDPATGRVHTTFNQAATTTGRLSSTNPNLQNIPIRTEIGRPVRACFVADAGNRLLSADYSQVELRVLAHVAEEEVLKEIFRAGEDVHAATAAEVFDISRDDVDVGQRSKAKMVNFGIVYGLTGFGLADRLNIPRKEGEEFVSRYLERFPAVRAFRERVVERAQEEGYVTTLMGRRRSIPELRSGNPNTRRLGERLAVNTVIQGTAADIIKVAMVRCRRALHEAGGKTRLVLQIHDELLFEGPPEEMDGAVELVRREMCAAYQLDPALEVDIGVGADWLDAK
ncbi:MAG TPA: DNA polymerase I [Solirubrobacterales bacterium]|jgi:DNA polymerase-1|nr:DNA polymerase I [Solirubrobacterales bacterium]